MTNLTTEPTIVIFHRSQENAEESGAHQQAFIESCKPYFTSVKVVEYVGGDHRKIEEIATLIKKQEGRIIVIVNSFLSHRDYTKYYNLHHFFQCFQSMEMLDLYLMDSEGKLYKEIEVTTLAKAPSK